MVRILRGKPTTSRFRNNFAGRPRHVSGDQALHQTGGMGRSVRSSLGPDVPVPGRALPSRRSATRIPILRAADGRSGQTGPTKALLRRINIMTIRVEGSIGR